ncbi:MAG: HAMP domain-containing histidine kinase, partial [Prevotella sp.]|nr:HAMP domain-containing histidine kinase [Prevotella sp.]
RFTSKMPAGVKLITQYACESQPMSTDYSRLCDVVRHLLSNAVKFTSQGSVTVGFDAPKNGRVDIWVQDTGKGIAPDNQQRIFDRFFKVDEFVPGAGLGLSLCSMLVSSLGGRITVDSVVGQGSKFVVNLPVG